jgi:hypothetical protein
MYAHPQLSHMSHHLCSSTLAQRRFSRESSTPQSVVLRSSGSERGSAFG